MEEGKRPKYLAPPDMGIGLIIFCLLVFGIPMVFGGVMLVTASPSDEVTCAGKVMHEGDTCEETSHGVTESHSYSYEKDQQAPSTGKTIWGIVLIIAGSGIILACLLGIRGHIRYRRYRRRSRSP